MASTQQPTPAAQKVNTRQRATLFLTSTDARRLEEAAKRYDYPSRHSVILAAMRRGLNVLESRP